MKILYVITALGVGGAEIVTINIANQIVSRGYGVTILHLREMNNLKSYIDPRVQTVTLSMTKSPVSFIKALFRASKFIKRWKPDIVHGQMFHANLFCRILRVFLRFPVLITTEHNKYIGGRLRMVLYRITDFLTDLNTNVSKRQLNSLLSVSHFLKIKQCLYIMVLIWRSFSIMKVKLLLFAKNTESMRRILCLLMWED